MLLFCYYSRSRCDGKSSTCSIHGQRMIMMAAWIKKWWILSIRQVSVWINNRSTTFLSILKNTNNMCWGIKKKRKTKIFFSFLTCLCAILFLDCVTQLHSRFSSSSSYMLFLLACICGRSTLSVSSSWGSPEKGAPGTCIIFSLFLFFFIILLPRTMLFGRQVATGGSWPTGRWELSEAPAGSCWTTNVVSRPIPSSLMYRTTIE